jgi:hypothetical protein
MTAFLKAEAETALGSLNTPQRTSRGGARGASAPRQRDRVNEYPASMDLNVAIGQEPAQQGAVVIRTIAAEWRVSGRGDRRMLRREGQRKEDQVVVQFSLRGVCETCEMGWATIASFTNEGGQSMLCFTCPHCGHLEHRVGTA